VRFDYFSLPYELDLLVSERSNSVCCDRRSIFCAADADLDSLTGLSLIAGRFRVALAREVERWRRLSRAVRVVDA
jgi:hypothetical protein